MFLYTQTKYTQVFYSIKPIDQVNGKVLTGKKEELLKTSKYSI